MGLVNGRTLPQIDHRAQANDDDKEIQRERDVKRTAEPVGCQAGGGYEHQVSHEYPCEPNVFRLFGGRVSKLDLQFLGRQVFGLRWIAR